ncbi:hypothetical protein D1614_23550 [Maribellus luteus]|uniref:HD domain-containing protein n=1 Tax=Maribellus luteus TaxID=2305463 RepID=A0A399SMP3_9BACT|nr:hypothetical protein [Maribellus luteus]RIJ45276.1 hypothetical protein D1614_23550 [Maribellus luteus]
MKSIKDYISELSQTEWDYYSEIEYRELENPFTSRLSHKQFVIDYFKRSGKNKVLEFLDYIPERKLDNNRVKHTNSIFFLGILLYNKTNLYNEFFENLNTAEYRRFPFLWFLACLFHDFGFTVENDETAINGINNISDLKQKYSINNCLLQTNPKEVNQILFKEIENYFNYRISESKVIDHGIFAGLYFFDCLIKIRKKKIQQNDSSLFWGKELEEQYAQIATAIATHNIWLPKNDQHDIYKKYQLQKLIDNFKPIIFNDFPLLYVLGIVDTIDPMKTYMRQGFKPNEILENLELEFYENIIKIKNGSKSNLDFQKMTDNIKGLNDWLNIGIEYNKNELKLELR